MIPTAEQIEAWHEGNSHYPDHLVPLDRSQWPTSADSPFGSTVAGAFRSRSFVVIVWTDPSGFTRLSINRTEWDDTEGRLRGGIGWDELQRLKSEAGFGEVPAVELYPPDSNVFNTANVRHLFLLAKEPDFMWQRTASLTEAA